MVVKLVNTPISISASSLAPCIAIATAAVVLPTLRLVVPFPWKRPRRRRPRPSPAPASSSSPSPSSASSPPRSCSWPTTSSSPAAASSSSGAPRACTTTTTSPPPPTTHHRHRVVVTVHDDLATPRRSGLEEAAIHRIPTFRYRHGATRHQHLVLAEAKQPCAVCLADFRDGERLRVLPPCLHAFHIDCIDAWLQSAASCPLCRAAVVSDPAAALHYHLGAPAVPPRATDDVVVIDVFSTTDDDDEPAAAPSDETASRNNSCTMGGRGGDGCFLPMRRSLSMDSCTDKRFYLALQRILQHQSSAGSPALRDEEDGKGAWEGSNAAADTAPPSSRRLRRSFFSFSQSRGSRNAVLPL